jgi:hypothetical protein
MVESEIVCSWVYDAILFGRGGETTVKPESSTPRLVLAQDLHRAASHANAVA